MNSMERGSDSINAKCSQTVDGMTLSWVVVEHEARAKVWYRLRAVGRGSVVGISTKTCAGTNLRLDVAGDAVLDYHEKYIPVQVRRGTKAEPRGSPKTDVMCLALMGVTWWGVLAGLPKLWLPKYHGSSARLHVPETNSAALLIGSSFARIENEDYCVLFHR